MMKCYAVLDTNVLVSALLSSHDDAATVQVIGRLFSGEVVPLFNEDILNEYNEVLRRNRFHFSEETVHILIGVMEKFGEVAENSNVYTGTPLEHRMSMRKRLTNVSLSYIPLLSSDNGYNLYVIRGQLAQPTPCAARSWSAF